MYLDVHVKSSPLINTVPQSGVDVPHTYYSYFPNYEHCVSYIK